MCNGAWTLWTGQACLCRCANICEDINFMVLFKLRSLFDFQKKCTPWLSQKCTPWPLREESTSAESRCRICLVPLNTCKDFCKTWIAVLCTVASSEFNVRLCPTFSFIFQQGGSWIQKYFRTPVAYIYSLTTVCLDPNEFKSDSRNWNFHFTGWKKPKQETETEPDLISARFVSEKVRPTHYGWWLLCLCLFSLYWTHQGW